MISRLSALFRDDIDSRFRILFGPGIEDQFYIQPNEISTFDYALHSVLKEKDYKRVVFIAPHKPVYFLDLDSKSLTLVGKREKKQVVEKSVNNQSYLTGPLGELNLLGEKSIANPQGKYSFDSPKSDDVELSPFNNMGDNFAIRMLDDLMNKADGIPTAIVVLQAETYLRFSTDQRSTAGLIGEWSRQKSLNHNICCFVFSANQIEDLNEQFNRIPVPELRSLMVNGQSEHALIRVGYPQGDEISRLLAERIRTSKGFSRTSIESLQRSILAEGGKLSLWLQRIHPDKTINALEDNYAEWFSHYLPGEKRAVDRLQEMIGLTEVKDFLKKNVALMGLISSLPGGESPNLHMMFVGHPGTGKTTVARLLGEIYFEAKVLSRGHLVEVQASDLIADFEGGTALKTNGTIDQAIGGVLFVDEAYTLTDNQGSGFAKEALDTLLLRMENDRKNFIVVFAGYPAQMKRFRESNPGLTRRIPEENILNFQDYIPEELFQILEKMLTARNFHLDQQSHKIVEDIIQVLYQRRDQSFGNAGEMRNMMESMIRHWAYLHNDSHQKAPFLIHPEDIPEQYLSYVHQSASINELFNESFSELIGLDSMKNHLWGYLSQIEYQQIKQEITTEKCRISPEHMVFFGNPGTGKTTVARKLGELYKQAGLLRKGHCVEVSRSELVGGYVGQTAIKTMEVLESALDGILFIDEAYSLNQGHQADFGQEAITTIVKAMEDYRDRLVVIFAGYEAEMSDFLNSNPGLASRIPHLIHFEDFSEQQLGEILTLYCGKENYRLPDEVRTRAVNRLTNTKHQTGTHFGNARAVRNLFQTMKKNLSIRVIQMEMETLRKEPQLLYLFEIEDLGGITAKKTRKSSPVVDENRNPVKYSSWSNTGLD